MHAFFEVNAISNQVEEQQRSKVTNGAQTVFKFQLFGLAITILACTAFFDAVQIKLLFIGGMICVLPTFVFARLIFRQHKGKQLTNEQQVSVLAGSLYIGEFLKLILTIILFALTFQNFELLQAENPQPMNALFIFIGYVVTQLSSLIGARFQQKRVLEQTNLN